MEKQYVEEIKDKKLLDKVAGILKECGIDSDKLDKENSVEVAHDSDVVYDIRVFDPYHHAGNVYTNADGWTNWLLGYTDPEGNDIDSIFDK